MPEYLRLELKGRDMNTICRLCLGENVELLHVSESKGIPGWTAANAINELLRIEISEGDIYPKFICTECMGKLTDFKLFKNQCEINKDLLDLEYRRRREVGDNEAVAGTVVCSSDKNTEVYIKQEYLEVPIEKDPLELSEEEKEVSIKAEIEESSNGNDEIPSAEVIGSADQIHHPIKCENDQVSSMDANEIIIPDNTLTTEAMQLKQEHPEVNIPCQNNAYSYHSMKKQVLIIRSESISNRTFEEGTSMVSVGELNDGVNSKASLCLEMKGCSTKSYMSPNVHSIRPLNEKRDTRYLSSEQKEILLDFVSKHSALTTHVSLGTEEAEAKRKLWECLADQLNAVPWGAYKCVKKWQKTWRDLKCEARKKAAFMALHAQETRGGTRRKRLSPEQERVLSLLEENKPLVTGADVADKMKGTNSKNSPSTSSSSLPPHASEPSPSETDCPAKRRRTRSKQAITSRTTRVKEESKLLAPAGSSSTTSTSSTTTEYQSYSSWHEHSYCFPQSPAKGKQKLDAMGALLARCRQSKRKSVSALESKLKRQKHKLDTMEDLLQDINEKGFISEDQSAVMAENFTDILTSIIERSKQQMKGEYSPSLKSFALTLQFYSPRAYEYVRESFGLCLPHQTTLRRWNRSVEGLPGFTAESLEAIKAKASEDEGNLYVSLMYDEMAIRKKMEWNGREFVGYEDFGMGIKSDNLALAREALVFMVVGLNSSWKVPIGYFLIDSITADQKCSLVCEALKILYDVGVKVISLTFDGTNVNLNVAKILGASLSPGDPKPWFPHPMDSGMKVYIFLDASHMVKLVRNLLGDKKELSDVDGNLIKWEYFVKLNQLQQNEGLHLANKLKNKHIFWAQQKMKVNLATQVLSNSVATAFLVLEEDMKHPDFQGAAATANFCLFFDRLFDIMNSKNPFAKGNKAVMRKSNEKCWRPFLEGVNTYLQGLTDCVSGKRVVDTIRKVGVLGFLCNSVALIDMYEFLSKEKAFKYLPTYKMSQDHLEMFFSLVRARGGWNNNPSCAQFRGAYRLLLIHNRIQVHGNGNCISQDVTKILITQIGVYQGVESPWPSNEESDTLSIVNNLPDPYISEVSREIITYISGFVIRNLTNKIKCSDCVLALHLNSPLENVHLFYRKQKGGLTAPNKSVVMICMTTEKCIRKYLIMFDIKPPPLKNFCLLIQIQVLEKVATGLFPSMKDHMYDAEYPENHVIGLVKMVVKEYVKVRMHHIAKCVPSGKNIRSKLRQFCFPISEKFCYISVHDWSN